MVVGVISGVRSQALGEHKQLAGDAMQHELAGRLHSALLSAATCCAALQWLLTAVGPLPCPGAARGGAPSKLNVLV